MTDLARPGRLTVAMVLCIACAPSHPSPDPAPDRTPVLILARPDLLLESKHLVEERNIYILPAYEALMRDAASALRVAPFSVMQKKTVPPSGDKHDYLSMAPYWWPDSTKPDGLPYVRRDGQMNPQTRLDHDGLRFGAMVNAVETLALAYWFTNDDVYADKAASLVRTWFIDPTTRMNPNLRFAQAILGVTEGRGIGILDLRAFPRLLDAMEIMRPSRKFGAGDEAGFREWCGAYLDWLVQSTNGRDERSQANNHGTLYDMQAAALALYLGRASLARELAWDGGRARVDSQVAADGSQPLELARTRPIHYSLFNLDAFTQLAEMARHAGVNLWVYPNAKGGSIVAALQFIIPYATGEREWSKPDIAPIEGAERSIALRRAGTVLGNPEFLRAAVRAGGDRASQSREVLFYPGIPHGRPSGVSTTTGIYVSRTDSLFSHAMEVARSRLMKAAVSLNPGDGYPRSTLPDGRWDQRPFNQWTSGFFAGALWSMYQADRTNEWKELARKWTLGIEPAKSITTTHDLGFMVFNSFGRGYLLTGDTAYRNVVVEASRSLARRYNSKTEAIQSWNTYGGNDARREWKYPVIIDNMMNLEMLFRASAWGNREWKTIAWQHARTSARAHVRADGSTAHVALFDPVSGRLERTVTWQGWSDSSTWARGQAWAIYGFTSSYGFTRDDQLLRTAERTADWFIAHLPPDGVPWWDLRHPKIPDVERDASAAAIAASGLLDLARYVSDEKAARYRRVAERILRTLSLQYLTDVSMASILAHSVGGRPQNTEIDVGLIYADYYFVEALLRHRGLYLQ